MECDGVPLTRFAECDEKSAQVRLLTPSLIKHAKNMPRKAWASHAQLATSGQIALTKAGTR